MLAVALITRLWEWVWLLSSSAFVPIVLASSACLCLILKSKFNCVENVICCSGWIITITCKPDGNEHDQTEPKVDSKGASHLQLCVAVSLPELFTRNHFLVPVRKWKAEVQILKNMNAFVEHYFFFELSGGCPFHEEH